jgi:hypothetical protein
VVVVNLQGTISAGAPQVGQGPPPLTAIASVKELEQFDDQNPFTNEGVPALAVGVVVPFGPVAGAKFVWIHSTGPITLSVTSAAGAAQKVPCDGTLILKSRDVPMTAITFDVGNSTVDVSGIVAGD